MFSLKYALCTTALHFENCINISTSMSVLILALLTRTLGDVSRQIHWKRTALISKHQILGDKRKMLKTFLNAYLELVQPYCKMLAKSLGLPVLHFLFLLHLDILEGIFFLSFCHQLGLTRFYICFLSSSLAVLLRDCTLTLALVC